jgi:hypothetical protein
MPSKTLLQLRQDARRTAGYTADSDAVSDPVLDEYINQAYHELYDLIIDADDGRIFATNATNPPSLGDYSFKLPGDFYRLISCHVRRGEHWIPAERADASEYAELASSLSTYHRPKYYTRWKIVTGEWFIFVFPNPGSESLAITYFPAPTELSIDSDSLDNPASWLSFITYGAAIKMLNQLERDPSAQLLEFKRLGQRIQDSVADLDMNSPAFVRDTDGRYGGGTGGGGYF